MTLPNFLIIGAAKSGTTSLYNYLSQHPQVYVKVKEPGFFAYEGQHVQLAGPEDQAGFEKRVIQDRVEYEELFDGITDEKAYGEASVAYLYLKEAATRIKHYIPDARMIVILRNPIDRAFSSYWHMRRDGREPLTTFEEGIAAEESRIKGNWDYIWHYTQLGFYARQLALYYRLFPRENIATYLFEDFKRDPVNVVQSICRFLEIDDTFNPNTSLKYNVSGVPRLNRLHQFVSRPNKVKTAVKPLVPLKVRKYIGTQLISWNVNGRKPVMQDSTRMELQTLFRDDILHLQDLIEKDLSAWLTDDPVK